MKKIIIAPDSFKGSLSAAEICDICEESIAKFFPECEVIKLPIADGGEGTVDCFLTAMTGKIKGKKIWVRVHGPFMEEIDAYYGRFGDTAVVEMAKAAGLPLAEGRLDPLSATTYGVGEMILHAVKNGAKRIIVGLGGSATSDGGCGCAAALGTVFFDNEGKKFVPTGGSLDKICRIDNSRTDRLLQGVNIIAMCDIDYPMYGKNGAAYIFGPQKGADHDEVTILDENLRALDKAMTENLDINAANIPGSGAAGAMGAGIIAFLNGTLRSGIEVILDMVEFDMMLEGCDAVVTGEGRIDAQSLHGKAVSGVAARGAAQNVPVYVFAGQIADDAAGAYDIGVTAMFSINRRAETFEMSRERSSENFRAAFEYLLRVLRSCEASSPRI